MPKPNVIAKQDKSQGKNLTEWDNAILDAKKGIQRLKAAIETCEEMKAKGEPWPGSLPDINAS